MNHAVEATGSSDTLSLDLRQRFGVDMGQRKEEQALQHAGRILEHLRTQLAELDRREQNLNSQLSSMDQERRSLRLWSQQFSEEAERREQEIRSREIKLAEREAGFDAFAAEVEAREKSLSAEWEAVAAARAAMKSELAEEIETERRELNEGRHRLEVDLRDQLRRESEFETSQALSAENSRREIESLRVERMGELDRRESEVTRREIDIEKRARFHEDHLDRVRRDLAEQKRELERERQRQRVWIEQVEESVRLRLAHVRRFRDLVAQREQSIDHERDLMQKAKQAHEQESETSRQYFQEHWQAFEKDRVATLAELERRTNDLAQCQEAVELQGKKLDDLHQDINSARQDVLEQRVVLEQTRIELDRSIGSVEAEARIQEVQDRLNSQWRHVRESLVQQRDDLETSRRSLQQFRDEFQNEREVLTNWVHQREYQLKAIEEALVRERHHSQEIENRWSDSRDRWREEKIEAENVIRGLLLQLEIMTAGPPVTTIPMGPLGISPGIPSDPGESLGHLISGLEDLTSVA